jgi:hypothetical protein
VPLVWGMDVIETASAFRAAADARDGVAGAGLTVAIEVALGGVRAVSTQASDVGALTEDGLLSFTRATAEIARFSHILGALAARVRREQLDLDSVPVREDEQYAARGETDRTTHRGGPVDHGVGSREPDPRQAGPASGDRAEAEDGAVHRFPRPAESAHGPHRRPRPRPGRGRRGHATPDPGCPHQPGVPDRVRRPTDPGHHHPARP